MHIEKRGSVKQTKQTEKNAANWSGYRPMEVETLVRWTYSVSPTTATACHLLPRRLQKILVCETFYNGRSPSDSVHVYFRDHVSFRITTKLGHKSRRAEITNMAHFGSTFWSAISDRFIFGFLTLQFIAIFPARGLNEVILYCIAYIPTFIDIQIYCTKPYTKFCNKNFTYLFEIDTYRTTKHCR